ncbi:MAG TPA: hypothetical protein VH187_23225 [Scandinavium sp.]|jgi:hypothetical protein|uniref:hypothetical protein n=1 Tax=Scandinavium sp. TaxID=2830653 RepID=UPI002E30076E|nr:hypothetical protein [Scandinavium sp.]HEX4504042.1 hypothetical protein [Scandinavium sp.]
MNNEELVKNLRYLINKYIPESKRNEFERYLSMEDIPVKGILVDFNNFSTDSLEESDGALIRDIYFHYC